MTTVARSPIQRKQVPVREIIASPSGFRIRDIARGRTLPSTSFTGRPPSHPVQVVPSAPSKTRPGSVGIGVARTGTLGNLEIAKWKKLNHVRNPGKVFIIEGDYPDVRKALLERGWVENTDVHSPAFDLKWTRVSKLPTTLEEGQMINHFKNIFHISAKSNFTFNLKRMPAEEVDRFYPRSYSLSAYEKLQFMNHFKCCYVSVMQAEGVLKSYQAGVKIALRRVAVALGICQRMLQAGKQVQVLDLEWLTLSSHVFKEAETSFSAKYTSKQELDERVSEILRELTKKLPQSSLNQGKNIWIFKPGSKSRGRDISLVTSLAQLEPLYLSPSLWVVQKYIENPLLMKGRKVTAT